MKETKNLESLNESVFNLHLEVHRLLIRVSYLEEKLKNMSLEIEIMKQDPFLKKEE